MSATIDTKSLSMLIGGERVAAAGGETIGSHDPASGELLGSFPRGGADDVAAAVAAAQAAYPAWRKTPTVERAACLNVLADLIAGAADELALLDVLDNGSPIREMRNDAHIAVAQLRYFAGIAPEARGETIDTGPGRLNYTLRQPFGVVGRIIPFNHPLMFAATKIAAPLVAGNTVIAEALRAHLALGAPSRRHARRGLPARRRQRRHRLRRRGRRSAGPPPRGAPPGFHRLGRDRPLDPARRRRIDGEDGLAGARRQERRSRSSPTPTSTSPSKARCEG